MTAFSPLKTSLRLALAAFLTLTEDGLISLQDGHKVSLTGAYIQNKIK
jgi:hypothetical protein